MAADEESLNGLTCLLNELFEGPALSRIHQIQDVLASFEKQDMAWKSAIYYISNSQNEKVIMYCLKLIENVVLKRWSILSDESKTTVRHFLESYLNEGRVDKVNFLLNKCTKVLVDIARIDWPHSYPDFFVKVCQFLYSDNHSDLGLLLLHMASEEMIHPRETVNSTRRSELRQALLAEVPVFLRGVACLVVRMFGEDSINAVCTAFSSFEEGSFQTVLNSGGVIFQLSTEGLRICRLLLSCLSSLFTWIPLNTVYQKSLLATVTILSLCTHGLMPNNDNNVLMNEIGILALNCMQELLERKDNMNRVGDYLRHVFHIVFCHLLLITKSGKNVSEEYQIKLTEILRFLMSNFFSAMEEISEFPASHFLMSLKEFTFKNTKCLNVYFPCLEVWKVYLEFLKVKSHSFTEKNGLLLKPDDKAVVLGMGEAILMHSLFNESGKHLNELEDDIGDAIDFNADDCEYRSFLKESFNVLQVICDFYPKEILQFIGNRFVNYWRTYTTISGVRVREHEMRRLHWILRDLATSMQAIGAVSEHLKSPNMKPLASELVRMLVSSLIYGCSKSFYLPEIVSESEIRLDFVQVHAQNFASLQSFVSILFSFSANRDDENSNLADTIQLDYVEKMMSSIAKCLTLEKATSTRIQHAATSLLYSICVTLHPLQLLSWESFQQIYTTYKNVDCLECLGVHTARLLVQSISSYLLLESSVVNQERDLKLEEVKLKLHVDLLESFCTACLSPSVLMSNRKKFQWGLSLVTEMLNSVDQLSSFSRRACLRSLEENNVLPTLTEFMTIALGDAETCVVYLNFFVSFTRSLGNVIQQPMVGKLIATLLEAFNNQTTLDTPVVESLLAVLLIIIDYRQVFIPLIGNILKLCLFHIYPILARNEEPDGKLCLYQVFFAIVNNGFSHFFRAARPNSIRESLTKKSDTFTPDNQEEFTALMQAVGAAFMQTDIEVVRANLVGLMKLNESRRLFSIQVFRETMLPKFMDIILDCLVSKNFDLLIDPMRNCLFDMAMAYCEFFFNVFLPNYIFALDGLVEAQKTSLYNSFTREKDLPTFSTNIDRLVNDIRFFRMCNEGASNDNIVFSV